MIIMLKYRYEKNIASDTLKNLLLERSNNYNIKKIVCLR